MLHWNYPEPNGCGVACTLALCEQLLKLCHTDSTQTRKQKQTFCLVFAFETRMHSSRMRTVCCTHSNTHAHTAHTYIHTNIHTHTVYTHIHTLFATFLKYFNRTRLLSEPPLPNIWPNYSAKTVNNTWGERPSRPQTFPSHISWQRIRTLFWTIVQHNTKRLKVHSHLWSIRRELLQEQTAK